ncbi:MAG: YncE family protein [Gammaproteobacteria bacterium]|nr:YncE family protein [Gammaproteobacteria bacterium]
MNYHLACNKLFIFLTSIVATIAFVSTANGQSTVELDFEYFKNEVQPIFLAKRRNNVTCIQCHVRNRTFPMQALEEGKFFWTEEQSRLNFQYASAFTRPGEHPLKSRLLTHALSSSAGGDPFHGGGKHFLNQNDPEWRIMADWVAGAKTRRKARDTVVRIVQTSAAGDSSAIIDPVTNTVVAMIEDVSVPHGVTSAPDGSQIYLTNESLHTLDIIDSRTLRVKRRIHLSGRPNNVAVSKDGSKVYVAIMQEPGAVDVIDIEKMENVKSIMTVGPIHNVYVTPDGKYAVAGSIQKTTINVIDTVTDELAWTKEMDAGIRPMTFDTHPDGSTRNIFVQLSGHHGFVAIDFNSHEEVARIEHPAIADHEAHTDGLQGAPAHGIGVAPNGKTIWSTSKVYSHAYVYSLPDLKEIGHVYVGQHPEWVTFTPDSKTVYIGAAGENATYAVDVETLTVVAKIDVGQVPKRVGMVLMQVD